ncbi:MAG TPA: hypothetical protein VGI10_10370 [Polyangiaceae bacterium]
MKYRSLLNVSRKPLIMVAGGLCMLNALQACGSSGSSSGTPADSGAAAGVAGSNAAGTAGANASGNGSTSGGASAGGTQSTTGGMSGSTGTSGTGTAGASGTAGVAGAAGSTGNCDTPPTGSALVGWASQSGMGVTTTTGGGNAAPQTVTTLAALTAAVADNTAKVVYVKGVLAAGKVKIGSNKTIVGLCGAEIHGHLGMSGSSNVIIQNLTIVGYGSGDCTLDPDYDATVGCSSGNDAITVVDSSHHIWVDHCDISDGTDGNLDITQGSDFVTVSWTKFHYKPRTDNNGNDSTGAEGHRFSNLIGAADNVPMDTGHLNVTWHHDWWADNVNQRMPRSRAGKIHLFNDVFTAKGDSYCSNAGQGANLLVENTVYDGVKAPFQVNGGSLVSNGNTFPNSTGTETGSGAGFTPPYTYTLDATAGVEAAVEAGAGPH